MYRSSNCVSRISIYCFLHRCGLTKVVRILRLSKPDFLQSSPKKCGLKKLGLTGKYCRNCSRSNAYDFVKTDSNLMLCSQSYISGYHLPQGVFLANVAKSPEFAKFTFGCVSHYLEKLFSHLMALSNTPSNFRSIDTKIIDRRKV